MRNYCCATAHAISGCHVHRLELAMGGENCSVYGCPCSRSRCPGLSFFTINTCGGKTTNPEILEWRRKLVAACQRMPPFNEKTAHICSRHFAPECMEEKGMCHFTIMNHTYADVHVCCEQVSVVATCVHSLDAWPCILVFTTGQVTRQHVFID